MTGRPADTAETFASVADCDLVTLPRIERPEGNITAVEAGETVPFALQRVYFVYDIVGGSERGGHAHRTLEQLLVAVSGAFTVVLDDGTGTRRVQLDRAHIGLHMRPMIWRELVGFSSGAALARARLGALRRGRLHPRPRRLPAPASGRTRTAMTEAIPFVDLGPELDELAGPLAQAVQRVIASRRFVLGAELEEFERELAAAFATRHPVGVASGTDALELALRALGIGPGDEVITVAHTFIATGLAITATGAQPVFVDVRLEDGLIDPQAVEAAVGPRTRAIVPVHLYGRCADMDAIAPIAARHGLHVVEDAAQAHGATYRGRPAGSLGELACLSFYPSKNLGALGDAGAVLTAGDELDARLRLLRNYGEQARYEHVTFGRNSRCDELQAAILRVKLAHLERWNASRRRLAGVYLAELRGVTGDPPPGVTPLAIDLDSDSLHLFVVRADRRAELAEHLARRGIATQIHYPIPLHRQGPYAAGWVAGPSQARDRAARPRGAQPADVPVAERGRRTPRVCGHPRLPAGHMANYSPSPARSRPGTWRRAVQGAATDRHPDGAGARRPPARPATTGRARAGASPSRGARASPTARRSRAARRPTGAGRSPSRRDPAGSLRSTRRRRRTRSATSRGRRPSPPRARAPP